MTQVLQTPDSYWLTCNVLSYRDTADTLVKSAVGALSIVAIASSIKKGTFISFILSEKPTQLGVQLTALEGLLKINEDYNNNWYYTGCSAEKIASIEQITHIEAQTKINAYKVAHGILKPGEVICMKNYAL